MSGSLTRLITRNWAIKLAALALALMLYVAVAAQQPVTQTFSLKIVVLPPPVRVITREPERSCGRPDWGRRRRSVVATRVVAKDGHSEVLRRISGSRSRLAVGDSSKYLGMTIVENGGRFAIRPYCA